MEINSIEDIRTLKESKDIECKLAGGRDKKGEVPKDLWETYSAFANTNGGTILLGVKELKNYEFELIGIESIEKFLDEFWTAANNPQIINSNILAEKDVEVINIDEKLIVSIQVPRCKRESKPIFRRSNPLLGTYKRLNSSDVLCTEEETNRMLAEKIETSRDDKLLENFNMDDLYIESLRSYRQIYSNRHPTNERNSYSDIEFLRSLGGWRQDRTTKQEGLTIAGLLMFGKLESIQEVFPNYMLDYQERPEAKRELRWIDRVTLDGSWSGNLFDFYHKVYRKLTYDLKVPFILEGDTRKDNTPVHDSLREAFVNALVHADYTERASVLIVKRPDMFGFRNPGTMRISVQQAIKGYDSDCRNRKLHQMFHFIGLGERAGSGIPNIYRWWDLEHWKSPSLYEKLEPYNQTLLELHMVNLFPEEIMNTLQEQFGEAFNNLDKTERVILATAATERTVTHARLKELITEHSADISNSLHKLTKCGMLNSVGYGQGMVYSLSTQEHLTPEDVFDYPSNFTAPEVSSGGSEVNSGGIGLDCPIYSILEDLEETLKDEMLLISKSIREAKSSPKEDTIKVILLLCKDKYLTLKLLGVLLNRSEEYLRKEILNPLGINKKIVRAFPQTPNDPRQAYKTA